MPLKDCTDYLARGVSRRTLIAMCGLALGFGLLWLPAQASADGDPASDVLATQTLFLPADAGVSATQQAQITALLTSAQRSGLKLRVAVVASTTDLGSIGELWRQPQTYARFLGQELGLVYRGMLLVVMPNGYGLDGVGGVPVSPTALRGLALPSGAIGTAAIAAILRLAAASGHRLPLPAVRAPAPPGSNDAAPWAAFAAGLLLVGLAWTASLRAKPIRRAPSA